MQYDSIQKNIYHSQCSFNSQLHVRFLTSATQLLVANSVRNFTRTLCITAQWNFGLADLINELIQQESLAKSESCHLFLGVLGGSSHLVNGEAHGWSPPTLPKNVAGGHWLELGLQWSYHWSWWLVQSSGLNHARKNLLGRVFFWKW